MPRNDRKGQLIGELEKLLSEVPGCQTSWPQMAIGLRQYIPVRFLIALHYRIERAISQSFDEGVQRGQRMVEHAEMNRDG